MNALLCVSASSDWSLTVAVASAAGGAAGGPAMPIIAEPRPNCSAWDGTALALPAEHMTQVRPTAPAPRSAVGG